MGESLQDLPWSGYFLWKYLRVKGIHQATIPSIPGTEGICSHRQREAEFLKKKEHKLNTVPTLK